MDELDRLVAAIGYDLLRRAFVAVGARGPLRTIDRREASRVARRLLDKNVSRRDIVERLQAFDFSPRTCYTIIEECLQLRNPAADFAKTLRIVELSDLEGDGE